MSGRARSTRARRAELSQHFLRDASASRLVQATSISKSDLIVEIGSGRGALTKPVLKRAGRLIAVELDRYLVEKLRQRFGDDADVIESDFLDFALPSEDYSVIGNIPYSKSTEIIRKISEASYPPLDAWLVVQRELASRMCGLPFSNESLWSLRLKPLWHLEIVDRLRKTEFDPPPSVDSVFLHMSLRGRALIDSSELDSYLDLIKGTFQNNRPVVQSLRRVLTKRQIRRLALDLRFANDQLPNSLMFEQWLGIFRFIQRDAATKVSKD